MDICFLSQDIDATVIKCKWALKQLYYFQHIPLTQLKTKAELYLNTHTKLNMPLRKNKAFNFNK